MGGQWIGNEDLEVPFNNYTRAFITKDNINSLINVDPTLLSIDLDGNDYYILQELLKRISPEIIIVEYNAKFIPPIEFIVPYGSNMWDGIDFFRCFITVLCKFITTLYFNSMQCS